MLTTIFSVVWWLIAWWLLVFFFYTMILKRRAQESQNTIHNAEQKAAHIIKKAKIQAEEREMKSLQTIEKAHEDIQKRHTKIDEIEERLIAREEKFDRKMEKLDQDKESLVEQKEEIASLKQQQQEKLTTIAWMSVEEAKDHLFDHAQREYQDSLLAMKQKMIAETKQEATQEARKIIAHVLPRISADSVSQFTTTLVDIPQEDYKGKLIGREGRNIAFFEKTTGVELVIDDTPDVVKLSSLDHEKRFVAYHTLVRLIDDGRINPYYITQYYEETLAGIDDIWYDKGQEALAMTNISSLKPDIVRYVGKFFCRYSYGQNLRNHSIEVAKIAWALASEMWYDVEIATKAWLLHDIGKVIASKEESHTALGAAFLQQQWVDDRIVNAAASHHFEVPMTDVISWIVTSADALSSARPWARYNSKEKFFERMVKLEKLVMSIEWVKKVHIMQAWREIMVYVDPQVIPDNAMQDLLKTVGQQLHEHLDYPGIIRVVAIRENKMIEFLR